MILIDLNASRLLRSTERWGRASPVHGGISRPCSSANGIIWIPPPNPSWPATHKLFHNWIEFLFSREYMPPSRETLTSCTMITDTSGTQIWVSFCPFFLFLQWKIRPCVKQIVCRMTYLAIQALYKLQQRRGVGTWSSVLGFLFTVHSVYCAAPLLLQVHSKINSHFSVILVAGEDQVGWPETLRYWHELDSVCLLCWLWAWSQQIFKTICCYHCSDHCVSTCSNLSSEQSTSLPAIYRSSLIILYTLLTSSYSDCLIACLELILTTIFGLLFNQVSLDCWDPALNNALEAVLWDINNPRCRQLALFKWLSSLSSLLIPTLDRFVSIFSLSPASPGLGSPHRSPVTVYTCAELGECHVITSEYYIITLTVTPPTLRADSQLRNGHWAARREY